MRVFLRLQRELDILDQVHQLPARHPPILIADGAGEKVSTWAFSRAIYAAISRPCEYYTIPAADHYCNTAAIQNYIVSDEKALNALSLFLALWIQKRQKPT